jgi:hypothetical protein
VLTFSDQDYGSDAAGRKRSDQHWLSLGSGDAKIYSKWQMKYYEWGFNNI